MIDKYMLQEKLKTAISDYAKEKDIVLVNLDLQTQGRKFILRILVDQPEGGITLDRCAYLNNAIGQILDKENLIQDKYALEVSSPGLGRPLLTREDFSRCLNRKVRIFFSQCQEGRHEILGILISVTDTGLELDLGGQTQQIPFAWIKKGKQEI